MPQQSFVERILSEVVEAREDSDPDLIPLVYLDDKLAAIGDRWISSEFYTEKKDSCVSLVLKRG